jgi:hypothetical protein
MKISLTVQELAILIRARDLLEAKRVPREESLYGTNGYLVEMAHSAVLDVLHNSVLPAQRIENTSVES